MLMIQTHMQVRMRSRRRHRGRKGNQLFMMNPDKMILAISIVGSSPGFPILLSVDVHMLVSVCVVFDVSIDKHRCELELLMDFPYFFRLCLDSTSGTKT